MKIPLDKDMPKCYLLSMFDDPRTDEELLTADMGGDNNALNTLVKRYYDKIGSFLLKHSWFKDGAYRDEVKHRIFLFAIETIRSGRFAPKGPGTFRSWLYSVAWNICHESQREFAYAPKTLGKQLMDELPSDIESAMPEGEIEDQIEDASAKIEWILGQLTDEEKMLFRLVNQDKPKTYKEIQEMEPFNKYALVSIRSMVCRIRKFIFTEVQKWRDQKKK
ncbi:MAG: hypothetical protein V1701_08245 [Planctomycetota bacterium]